MKKPVLLIGIAISLGVFLGGCTNQASTNDTRASSVQTTTEPGVTGTGGGGGGGGLHVPVRTQP